MEGVLCCNQCYFVKDKIVIQTYFTLDKDQTDNETRFIASQVKTKEINKDTSPDVNFILEPLVGPVVYKIEQGKETTGRHCRPKCVYTL
jgi:hypothetical protein